MHTSLWDRTRRAPLPPVVAAIFAPLRAVSWRLICALSFLVIGLASQPEPATAQASGSAYQQTVLSIQQLIEAGNLDAAKSSIVTAFARYPNNGGLENLLGVVEIQQGSPEKARASFNAAIRHSPRLVSPYLNISRLDMPEAATVPARRAEALRLSEQALQLDPASDEALYNVASILTWQKNYQQSLVHLAKLSQSAASQIGVQAIRCSDEAALGHREQTTAAALALAANPDLSEQDAAGCLPALRAAHRADMIDAVYAAAAKLHPLSANGVQLLGLAQEAEGKPAEARATLEQAFSLEPTNAELLTDLTRVAEVAGDHQGALGYLAHARQLQPANAGYAYEFGVICVRMGLLGEARKALTEALRIEPENPQYNLSMGLVVSFSEDPSQAFPYLDRFHALRPNDAEGLLALGTASFRAKDFDSAAKWLQQAASNPTTAADAHLYLGRIARQQGQLEKAATELKQSLALRPDQPVAMSELGQIHFTDQDYTNAEKDFERALKNDPDNYLANYGLLQIYARTGDARREQQMRRFEEVRNLKDERDRQMMRVIEIHPDGSSNQLKESGSSR